MENLLKNAFVAGYERLLAWTDLLDQINVFPVADGDTGQNLKISLLPLGRMDSSGDALRRDLFMGAAGNSGNIAAAFFSATMEAETPKDLKKAIEKGRQNAWKALADPKPGSMLTVYDNLAAAFPSGISEPFKNQYDAIVKQLAEAVADTESMMPVLKKAGVVDAGALGMFIFFEAFLGSLAQTTTPFYNIAEYFSGKLTIKGNGFNESSRQMCVSTTISTAASQTAVREKLAQGAKSVVVSGEADRVKIHLHTPDPETVRAQMDTMGTVLDWSEESIEQSLPQRQTEKSAIHIMTDAAGSMTRKDAEQLGITLLDSCIIMDGRKFPETLLNPQTVYGAMLKGIRVSTAQTSLFQRSQAYQSVVNRHAKVLYICVGSVYTGNFDSARTFAESHESKGRLVVLDTGAASGRLGVIARGTALFAEKNSDLNQVLAFSRKAMEQSREYVFLDQLKYLVAGGRLNKTSGFFGDLLGLKPVITPLPTGATKVATVRRRKDQLLFALKKLAEDFTQEDSPHILLQFSDNENWVANEAAPEITARLPSAEIIMRPLSLTSGAHMGPGTWSMAYLPRMTINQKS